MNKEIEKICIIIQENYNKFGSREIRRLFHGRGGTYEGYQFVSIDLFPPAVFITLYEDRDYLWRMSLAEHLSDLLDIDTIVFQSRVKAPWRNEVLKGRLPEDHIIEEDTFKYSVSLSRGENPGIFPDMRAGREYVKGISSGKKVLNLFSYTCAFSVAAIGGGALSVLNMDMNSNSLSRGRLNHQLNDHHKGLVEYLSHNILKSFGKIAKKGPYDLIIIDPPPSQGNSFNLERDYGRILRRTKDFISEGGEILACLNSHHHDFQWFRAFLQEHLGDHRIIRELGAGEDFPEKNKNLGLKIIHLSIKA